MILTGHPERGHKLIATFVDVLGNKVVRHIVGPVQNCFRQRIQERIGTSADDHADHFISLLETAGVCVADKMTVLDDLLHLCAGGAVYIRTVVQDPADRGNRDPGHCGNVFNCVDFHTDVPLSFSNSRKR